MTCDFKENVPSLLPIQTLVESGCKMIDVGFPITKKAIEASEGLGEDRCSKK